MKIVIDSKIPYIESAARLLADQVVIVPGREFTPDLVRNADALIIRTRTHCNRRLLEGSSVRFIATATIGFDHIDTRYCREAGIAWSNAPGCNSSSVAQYIQSALLVWQSLRRQALRGRTIGIVGVGNVGNKVGRVAESLGMRVLQCDPPRAEREGATGFCSLDQIAAEADIISLHVPLCREGDHPTFHLADSSFFRSLRRKPLLLNTSRGEVVETEALLQALEAGYISDAVIDVWEQEPNINRRLLKECLIGTPHIAGYSADGKANATRMSLDALCRHFGLRATYDIQAPAPATPDIYAESYAEACLQIYNPMTDCRLLKAQPHRFEELREEYPLRREETAYTLHIANPDS